MKRYLIITLFFLLTGCSDIKILDAKSVTGQEQASLIWLSLAIMALVLIVVFILFIRFVVKYRYTEKRKDVIPQDVDGNLALELTWTIIPFILLAILAVPTLKITLDQSPHTNANAEKDGVHISVMGEQFDWTFTHENGKAVKGELVMPTDEKIVFHLTSKDVIHSFWIPELAGKVDLVPGEEFIYKIKDAEIGEYEGKCAEYCGIQHANMVFDVRVVSKEDYESYLEESE